MTQKISLKNVVKCSVFFFLRKNLMLNGDVRVFCDLGLEGRRESETDLPSAGLLTL